MRQIIYRCCTFSQVEIEVSKTCKLQSGDLQISQTALVVNTLEQKDKGFLYLLVIFVTGKIFAVQKAAVT